MKPEDVTKEMIAAFIAAPLGADRDAMSRNAIAAALNAMPAQHPDDEAVDRFAAAMKDKLAKARDAGRSGWQDPAWPVDQIRDSLYKHIAKGDPRDVANYCMFLWARDASTAAINAMPRIDALSTSVRMANEQAEKFEREWYLRGDELDAANSRLHEVATFCATVEQERDALKAERDALRKALAEFVHYADDCDDDSPELDRARAALAKEPT